MAAAEVVHSYRNLVFKLAQKYWRPGLDIQDLQQEAFEGLIQADATYDAAYNTKFLTWAWEIIRDRLQKYTRKNIAPLALPIELVKGNYTEDKAIFLGAMQAGNVEDDEYIDTVCASRDMNIVDRIWARQLCARLEKMHKRSFRLVKAVVVDYFIYEKTFDEIGKENGVTKQRIEQVYNQVHDYLHAASQTEI